jgi:pyruvate dehydrogenase E1 component alpha subunit
MSFVEDHGTSIFSQILSPAGEVVGRLPDISADELLRFYRAMVFGRLFSERMIALQRQVRMGTFSPVTGQEAVSVGMAAPLRQADWVLGSYREYLAYCVKGVPLLAQLDRWGGRVIGHFPREAVVLGSQMLHAVGIAQAIKYDQAANVVVAACGDGATSEGDFSEALNSSSS